jgi:hypothetical protein
MGLNVAFAPQAPMVVQFGQLTLANAIRAALGQATLGDFMYNTFSQSLRTTLVKSGTPRRIEVQGTNSLPVFVSVGGRWGVTKATIFADSAITGVGYVFIVVNSDGTLSMRLSSSSALNAFELLAGAFSDSGAAIVWLDIGALGLASVNGQLILSGANAGLRIFDQINSGWLTILRTSGVWVFQDSVDGIVFQYTSVGHNFAFAKAASFAAGIAVVAASGVTPGVFTNQTGQTVDTFLIDGSGITNGVLARWDKAGRSYQTQAAAPTSSASTGVGTGGTVTIDGHGPGGHC